MIEATPPHEITGPDSPEEKEEFNEEKLAGKFENPEELEKAYINLQAKLGEQTPQDNTEESPEEPPPPVSEVIAAQENQIQEFAEVIGVGREEVRQWSEDFYANGELGEDAYQKIMEKTNLPKPYIDSYLEGRRAQAAGQSAAARQEDLAAQAVVDSIGGLDQYTRLMEWARTNLPQGDQEAYNKVAASHDFDQIGLAARGLKARMEAVEGKTPNLVKGTTPTNSGGVFETADQVSRAMADPRYRTDTAYQEKVIRKLERSKVFEVH